MKKADFYAKSYEWYFIRTDPASVDSSNDSSCGIATIAPRSYRVQNAIS